MNRCSRVQCVVEQAASSVYMDSRSVTLRGTLAPGRYVVLPTTFLPGVTGRFLLRLFCHSQVRLRCRMLVCAHENIVDNFFTVTGAEWFLLIN